MINSEFTIMYLPTTMPGWHGEILEAPRCNWPHTKPPNSEYPSSSFIRNLLVDLPHCRNKKHLSVFGNPFQPQCMFSFLTPIELNHPSPHWNSSDFFYPQFQCFILPWTIPLWPGLLQIFKTCSFRQNGALEWRRLNSLRFENSSWFSFAPVK